MADIIKTLESLKLSDIENTDLSFLDEDMDLPLSSEQKKHLSPEIHSLLARDAIRRTIRKYGNDDGITVNEIIELTNLDKNTIRKHLEVLIGLREVYSLKKNKRLTLYYNNGKPLHHLGKKRLENGKSIFEISLAKGRKDTIFFYILEKRFSILEGEISEGAIMLPIDDLNDFIECLQELKINFGDISYETRN